MTGDALDTTTGDQPVPVTGGPDGDLAARVTHKIVGVVDRLNSVSAKPLTVAARGIVFGLLGVVLIVASLVLLTVGALRALDAYLPEDVWAAHLLLGSLFTLSGLFVWRKRKPRRTPQP